MKSLYESIFDIDNNMENMDYTVSSMNRLGIKSIIVTIFDEEDITNDENIKQVFQNIYRHIFDKNLNINIFDKKVNILDQYWDTLYINRESTKFIYTIVERCCKEILFAQENHKGMVDAYMSDWIKKTFKGDYHIFRYWRKSETFSIVFSPKKSDIIVRLTCSARTQ